MPVIDFSKKSPAIMESNFENFNKKIEIFESLTTINKPQDF